MNSLLVKAGWGQFITAWDQHLGLWVAIKENSLISPEARAHLCVKPRFLARLHHSNLPKVMDHFISPQGLQPPPSSMSPPGLAKNGMPWWEIIGLGATAVNDGCWRSNDG